jgi:hypothetical protein
MKKLGATTLGPIASAGPKLLIIEDEVATARTLARRTPVQASQQRFNNVSRLTPKLLEAPQQPAGPPTLTIVRNGQERG